MTHARQEITLGTTRNLQLQVAFLDLVFELTEAGASEREVVAAVVDLVHTGRVQLIGQIREGDFCEGKGKRDDRTRGAALGRVVRKNKLRFGNDR